MSARQGPDGKFVHGLLVSAEQKKINIRRATARWRLNNKAKLREKYQEWCAKNKILLKEKQRIYHAQSKKKRREYLERPEVRRRNNALAVKRIRRYRRNPEYALMERLRSTINNTLKYGCQDRSWREFIDYDVATLRAHLERQFHKGMTWENRGKVWHVDHIVPISELRHDIRACWALTNLRPLWAIENLKKTNKRLFLV